MTLIREYIPCDCYSHEHYVYLCFQTDEDPDPCLCLSLVVRPISWRQRLAAMWSFLRGREAEFGDVVLTQVSAARLVSVVSQYLDRSGQG